LVRKSAVVLLLSVGLLWLSTQNAWGIFGKEDKGDHWVGTWACSPQLAEGDNVPPAPGFVDTTLRQIIHVSVGGAQIRVRFSNAFGKTALTILAAHVAKPAGASAIQAATDKPLTFHGQPSVSIPAGALMYSDPLEFDLPALSDLAITIYVQGAPDGLTTHPGSRTTSYLAEGNFVSAPDLSVPRRVDHWYFLNGVDVTGDNSAESLVVLGDSLTDGAKSTTNGNDRWPDELARRLQADRKSIGVLNEGIGGNRLLLDSLGPNALARFDRDVLAQTAARWIIVLEGVNDIGTCTKACNLDSLSQQIIGAYGQIIARAHSHKIRVYGATITPFGGSFYASADGERARQTINTWIRAAGHFDGVIDFDAVTRDPRDPSQLAPEADSGDHLHPADGGYKQMGDSVDLKLFSK
jgi:lysophospholipase L1-like esterase